MTGDVALCLNYLYLILLIELMNERVIRISEDNIATTFMKRTNHLSKLNMIVLIELFFSISLEIRVFGYGEIGRIQEYKIAWLSVMFKNKNIITAKNVSFFQSFGSKSKCVYIANLRILVLAERSVELPIPVYTV